MCPSVVSLLRSPRPLVTEGSCLKAPDDTGVAWEQEDGAVGVSVLLELHNLCRYMCAGLDSQLDLTDLWTPLYDARNQPAQIEFLPRLRWRTGVP